MSLPRKLAKLETIVSGRADEASPADRYWTPERAEAWRGWVIRLLETMPEQRAGNADQSARRSYVYHGEAACANGRAEEAAAGAEGGRRGYVASLPRLGMSRAHEPYREAVRLSFEAVPRQTAERLECEIEQGSVGAYHREIPTKHAEARTKLRLGVLAERIARRDVHRRSARQGGAPAASPAVVVHAATRPSSISNSTSQ